MSDKSENPTCGNCRFWREHVPTKGECRRYPPQITGEVISKHDDYNPDEKGNVHTVIDSHWPMTFSIDTCGEWQALQTPFPVYPIK